ncbi:pre-mRNA-splicing factor SYF1-like [Tropilaelaps mercedesae]|uniref:Pre-mRNA-splicing factor SYF1 n=1 Tax=Tropilaelaps mercedesae TaxID=418985 RepID=A0A1V9XUJ1_9ACAR|nr:pre-mRNA-splicing factor SYF1-like [Tropilaelaps mercedesae]
MDAQTSLTLFEGDDVAYEEELLRNPYSVRHWLRYADFKRERTSKGDRDIVNLVYERALKELPGSYKIWHQYLTTRMKILDELKLCPTDPAFEDISNVFERALVWMHKMPRIWLMYCGFLHRRCFVTRLRHTFDRALRSLPITQHDRIWPDYLAFVEHHDIPETGVRIYRRFLKLSPESREKAVDYFISIGRLGEAAQLLVDMVNDPEFTSMRGKPKYQLWMQLCELMSKNPDKIVGSNLRADAIIRGGIKKYTDQQGKLWCSLADYYIRSRLFERARDVYEEAMESVLTVRDFSQIFDAYSQYEYGLIRKLLSNNIDTERIELELDLKMARYEYLMDRRPLLLNSVMLRQNPHNVGEWLKRVKLLKNDLKEIIRTFTQAVRTVDPKLACGGKLCQVWIEFAKLYESKEQVDDARIIFRKATQVPYSKVDELANVWCEYAEMELRHDNVEEAIKLCRTATTPPPRQVAYHDQSETVQMRLYKNIKVWSLYADLEESFGTLQSTKAVYDHIIDLRIATPQIILNCAFFLEENNYFEEAFRVYEKGVSLFKWPNVYDIWHTYLSKFLKRFGGTKLERARDLFEQCLEQCPAKYAKNIYLLYAQLEEEHGLARHAMSIYERAAVIVPDNEKREMFELQIKRAATLFGLTQTRPIYEKAIESLSDTDAIVMCIQFAQLECKLGEVDRARAIWMHCSQMCDPRTQQHFWAAWKEFEVSHGNTDTAREMLRIKRSVQATFNTQVSLNLAVAYVPSTSTGHEGTNKSESRTEIATSVAEIPGRAPRFVRAQQTEPVQEEVRAENPDEIDLPLEEEDEVNRGSGTLEMQPAKKAKLEVVQEEENSDDNNDDGDDYEVKTRAIPEELFGGLKSA